MLIAAKTDRKEKTIRTTVDPLNALVTYFVKTWQSAACYDIIPKGAWS